MTSIKRMLFVVLIIQSIIAIVYFYNKTKHLIEFSYFDFVDFQPNFTYKNYNSTLLFSYFFDNDTSNKVNKKDTKRAHSIIIGNGTKYKIVTAGGSLQKQIVTAGGSLQEQIVTAGGSLQEQIVTAGGSLQEQIVTAGGTLQEQIVTAGGSLQKQITEESNNDGLSIEYARIPEYFHQIDDKQAWMYSAFFDHVAAQNGRPLVRMFGVVKRNCLWKVFCSFNTEDMNFTTTGMVKPFPDHHNSRYRASYLECSLPSNIRPTYVTISFQNKQSTSRLQVQYPGPRIRNFTVCYSILHGNFNSASQLIESIEMNRILGADHFMVYKYSASAQVDKILSRYQEDGLLTVLTWPIPTLDSWYFSQMSAINDCFYRNRNTSRFVVAADTDEMILPRKHNNWMDLIHAASPYEFDVSRFINPSQVQTTTSMTGCFMVMSSRFTKNLSPNWGSIPSQFSFTDDEKKNITKFNMVSLSQYKRLRKIYKPFDQSKYIARPEFSYISGIHYVRTFTNEMQCVNINPSMALVHHYRISGDVRNGVIDTGILRFKDKLYLRVMQQLKLFPAIFI